MIILTIVISIFAWFFYGVSRVNAQGQLRVKNNGSWSSWTNIDPETATTANNVQTGTTWSSWAQVKDTTTMLDGKTYNIEAEITLLYNKSSSIDLVSATDLHKFNGSTLVAMDNKCTTTVETISIVLQKRYKYTIRCIGISGEGYYPYISLMSKANSNYTGNASIMVTKWEYHLNTDDSATNAVLNGINQATEIITNNNNQNTENIENAIENAADSINNANQGFFNFMNQTFYDIYTMQDESQKVCENSKIDKNSIKQSNYYITQNGTADVAGNQDIGITDYIEINNESIVKLKKLGSIGNAWTCVYNENYTKIECYSQLNLSNGDILTLPSNSKYIRFTLIKSTDSPNWVINQCKNGNQSLYEGPPWENDEPDENAQDDLEDAENELTDYLIDDSDINELEYSVDVNTNTAIWNIFNRLVTGNQIFYTGFITILFLGIIKLVLAR